MSTILGVGIATLDIINTVAAYPTEDTKSKIIKHRIGRGGNVTNTLVVLSQLAHQCHWAGVWVDETDGQIIIKDLANYQININHCRTMTEGKVPTSYIMLNQQSGSRTILHYRDLPEFNFVDFQKIDLRMFDWVHFEGRNIFETVQMIEWLKKKLPTLPISVEIEKPYPHVEILFPKADVLIFSKLAVQHYANDVPSFLQTMRQQVPQARLVCTSGSRGGSALDIDSDKILYSPAYKPPQIVDTLGAGDTFNAAIINGLCRKQNLELTLRQACKLAGRKCGQEGFYFQPEGFE